MTENKYAEFVPIDSINIAFEDLKSQLSAANAEIAKLKAPRGTCSSAIDCGMPCCVHIGRCYKALEKETNESEANLENAINTIDSLLQQADEEGLRLHEAQTEITKLKAREEWIWGNCKVVLSGKHYLRHDPYGPSYGMRDAIESRMPEEIRPPDEAD